MPTLAIKTPGTQLSLSSGHLVLTPPKKDNQPATKVPLHDVDRVWITPRSSVSSPALAELLRRNIPIHMLDSNGSCLGAFLSTCPPRGLARLQQYRVTGDEALCLPIANRLILAKIQNERRILQRLQQRHKPEPVRPFLETFSHLSHQAFHSSNLGSLRGTEGTSARLFLQHWSSFLPLDFPFDKRSTRPPLNPVNAVISYLSAIIYGELLAACHLIGLDTSLGVFHSPSDDRHALPLDLMEPFRPAIIYPLALRLFLQGILQKQHFKDKHPGVWLSTEGKQKLAQQYEKLVLREFYSDHLQHRTTLRTQIEKAPLIFKAALVNSDTFLPFQLNGTSCATPAHGH